MEATMSGNRGRGFGRNHCPFGEIFSFPERAEQGAIRTAGPAPRLVKFVLANRLFKNGLAIDAVG
jgi:hypothetical protein